VIQDADGAPGDPLSLLPCRECGRPSSELRTRVIRCGEGCVIADKTMKWSTRPAYSTVNVPAERKSGRQDLNLRPPGPSRVLDRPRSGCGRKLAVRRARDLESTASEIRAAQREHVDVHDAAIAGARLVQAGSSGVSTLSSALLTLVAAT